MIAALALLAALAAPPNADPSAKPASAPTADAAPGPLPAKGTKAVRRPPVASLPTIEGTVTGIDHRAHQLRLRAAEGELTLSFDRNTLVLGPTGAETPLQIVPGAAVKAGRDGPGRAAWLELRPTPSTPKATP